MPTYRLTLSYDGTDFAGSQVQPNQRTVQGELDRILFALAGTRVVTTFAGRTDRGVHAVGQIVAAPLPGWRASPEALRRALHAGLPDDLVVREAARCDDAFNPRFDATWREYRYWIVPGAVSPFLRRYAWMPRSLVDVDAMARGTRALLGTHDFASFASGGEGVPWSDRSSRARGTTRTVYRCECRRAIIGHGPAVDVPRDAIEIRVAADGFLPRMVRNIVGALVEVGQGRQSPDWIEEVLAARDRRHGSAVAPAQGLTLWRVGFGDDVLEDW